MTLPTTAGEHHRLVIAPRLSGPLARGLESAEVAGQTRSPEFVVESRRPDWPVKHDVERGGDSIGLAVAQLPGFRRIAKVQMAGGEPHQTGFRLRAPADRAFVADFPRRTPWQRRDRARSPSGGLWVSTFIRTWTALGSRR